MTIRHRNRRPQQQNGDADLASDRASEHKEDPYQGDEYEVLLKYAQDEAAKLDRGEDDGEDEEDRKETRLWYAPWKKVKTDGKKEKKIPPEWLKTDMTKGLSDSDIDRRRQGYGYNELQSPTENQFLKFVNYFRGPILYVMEIAVILSAGLRDWIDFGVIIGILFLNAGVGWYQEKQAGDIVAQLKAGIAMKATVVRNNREQEIEARELVVGDIIVIEEGSTIPADAKIVADYSDKDGSKSRGLLEKNEKAAKAKESSSDDSSANTHKHGDYDGSRRDSSDESRKDNGNNQGGDEDEGVSKGPSVCSVDQSAITGESLAVDKYLGDIAYYTCGVKRGKVYAVVQTPAPRSFVGRTAALVTSSNERGHFQIVLGGIGTTLLVMVIGFIFVVWIGGFFRGLKIATPSENNLLVYALIFFIIGVPVGLPCVTTTTMAVGAAYLARRKAIVQKLTAIESLAGVDMLCSDKTGTLTANKLSLNEPYIAPGVDSAWFMTVAVLASSHNVKSLDPIDKVTVIGLKDYPKAQENLRGGWKTNKFTPFDPVSKRITAEVDRDGRKYTCAKGAPNAILKLAKFDPSTAAHYRATAGEFAQRGFRSLGIASKEEGKDWQLLGLMSMSDPPRADTAATIREAIDLGVHIKMLTGDAVAIAKETCKALALGTNVFDSERLMGGGMAGTEVYDFVEAADGFAEVFPEHKYQVVDMLQKRGHLTAMTGDGVNDAPSLKKADCGIAVQGASDAARTAADVVFLDEGLSTIITSIKVARQIFHRMKAYIIYRIALCIHLEVYLMLSMLILNETIRVDLIVFLAIFADVATIAIAYDNAPYARKPVDWQLPKVWIISTVMGLLLAGGTWIIRGTLFLEHGSDRGGIVQNFGSVQEVLFLEVALTESWIIFITRLSQGPDSGGFEWPSFQLLAAVLGVDALATVFSLFGWISGAAPHGGWTDVVTVVRIWLYSFGVIVVVTIVYMIMNTFAWLDRVGRPSRSKKNEKLENFIAELQRMTLVHERDQDSYHFATAGNSAGGGPGLKGSGGQKYQDNQNKDDPVHKDTTTPKQQGDGGNTDANAAEDAHIEDSGTTKDRVDKENGSRR
ncbi:plasma-membrane proton-e [Leucogyrophana mollusca]|uniref:Plasma-membrane proton-e n=1 Tax=Leucogyrophana mollusca TaxID=85980 RepID=A0ACB8BEY5_9AGAM|nr:plasma-membrane proton-e [Leucogyrophana mollusca]